MKKDNQQKRVVFSTNPDYKKEGADKEQTKVPYTQQTLYVSLERLKGNKIATIISNFVGTDAESESLGKLLKTKCGTGGTVKDGIILIQGEKREQVISILSNMGFLTKKKGG